MVLEYAHQQKSPCPKSPSFVGFLYTSTMVRRWDSYESLLRWFSQRKAEEDFPADSSFQGGHPSHSFQHRNVQMLVRCFTWRLGDHRNHSFLSDFGHALSISGAFQMCPQVNWWSIGDPVRCFPMFPQEMIQRIDHDLDDTWDNATKAQEIALPGNSKSSMGRPSPTKRHLTWPWITMVHVRCFLVLDGLRWHSSYMFFLPVNMDTNM